MKFFHRYFIKSCKIFTAHATIIDVDIDGISPSVFYRELKNIYCICHNHRRRSSIGDLPMKNRHNNSIGIFPGGMFFFRRAFSVCKTIGFYFFLPTEVATIHGITEERYSDEHILSMKSSVNFLPTEW